MYLFLYCIYIVFVLYLRDIIILIVFILQSCYNFNFVMQTYLFIHVFIQTIFTHELF